MVCGYEAVKEVLQNDAFNGRANLPSIEQFTKGYGVAFSNSERWSMLRYFTFKVLKDFGFGKKSIECKIQEEARCLIEELKKSQGHPVNPGQLLMKASSNILCSASYGDRYDYSNEKFAKVLQNTREIIHIMNSSWGQLQSVFPTVMSYIPGPHRNILNYSNEMIAFATEIVASCQESLDPTNPRHFTDCFLMKMEENKDDPNTEYTMNNLLVVIYFLFLASAETISTTLQHALNILLKYPEVAEKLQKEIDQTIGQSRMVNMDDRPSMPYMQAVMDEIQRFGDIAPLNVPHRTTKDTTFRGFFIPKDTDVFPLLCTVHQDPDWFATPYKFNPNHFLDENGQYKKNEACIPFSLGKRGCPGENVARMDIFIFLTTILQNFTLTTERKLTEADIAPKLTGLLNAAIQTELSFKPR